MGRVRQKAMLELYAYNAGRGDCIRRRFGSGRLHNIFIDTGVRGFGLRFYEICSRIRESMDLLILTHADEDHIGGILSCLRRGCRIPFRKVIMNGQASRCRDIPLSVRQSSEVYSRLLALGIPVEPAYAGDRLHMDGAEIEILSPGREEVQNVEEQTPLGWYEDYAESLEELARKPLMLRDGSHENRKSIVVSFLYMGRRLLFTGDAWSDCITEAVPAGTGFDLIKMPHHGSVRNISEQWPEKLKCRNFLICADGRRHPDKQTIAKLASWYVQITVYSPADWWSRGFLKEDEDTGKIRFEKKEGLVVKW